MSARPFGRRQVEAPMTVRHPSLLRSLDGAVIISSCVRSCRRGNTPPGQPARRRRTYIAKFSRVPVQSNFVYLVRLFRFANVSGVDHVLLMLDTEDSRTMDLKFDGCFIQSGQPKTLNPLKLPHKVRTGDPKRQLCRRVA